MPHAHQSPRRAPAIALCVAALIAGCDQGVEPATEGDKKLGLLVLDRGDDDAFEIRVALASALADMGAAPDGDPPPDPGEDMGMVDGAPDMDDAVCVPGGMADGDMGVDMGGDMDSDMGHDMGNDDMGEGGDTDARVKILGASVEFVDGGQAQLECEGGACAGEVAATSIFGEGFERGCEPQTLTAGAGVRAEALDSEAVARLVLEQDFEPHVDVLALPNPHCSFQILGDCRGSTSIGLGERTVELLLEDENGCAGNVSDVFIGPFAAAHVTGGIWRVALDPGVLLALEAAPGELALDVRYVCAPEKPTSPASLGVMFVGGD